MKRFRNSDVLLHQDKILAEQLTYAENHIILTMKIDAREGFYAKTAKKS